MRSVLGRKRGLEKIGSDGQEEINVTFWIICWLSSPFHQIGLFLFPPTGGWWNHLEMILAYQSGPNSW